MAHSIPTFQKAVLVENPGENVKVSIRSDVSVRTPGSHEVLVKLTCTGICGSEVRALHGWASYDAIVGHEGVGVVVQVGQGVSESLLNKRVGIKWFYSACGDCHVCQKGFPNYCPKQVNTSRGVAGTLQQYAIADSRYLTEIPQDVPDEIAAPLLCAGLTMTEAVFRLDSHLAHGDWVVILGAGGGLGHLGVQIASRMRKYRVIAVDTGNHKRELCEKSGAEFFVDFATENVYDKVKSITGEGAAAVLVVTGSQEAFALAPGLVRNMGVIATIGLPRNDYALPISATICAARGLTIMGIAPGTEDQMQQLLQEAAAGRITPEVQVLEFDDAPGVLERIKEQSITGRVVIRVPQ